MCSGNPMAAGILLFRYYFYLFSLLHLSSAQRLFTWLYCIQLPVSILLSTPMPSANHYWLLAKSAIVPAKIYKQMQAHASIYVCVHVYVCGNVKHVCKMVDYVLK